MSRTLKKKKHWSSKVVECAVSWGNLGDFGSVVEILGGAEMGQFPYLGQMKLDVLVCHVGKLPYYGDVLLEVNGTPVSGLTNRDTLAVIRHFREPIRLKTVKPEWSDQSHPVNVKLNLGEPHAPHPHNNKGMDLSAALVVLWLIVVSVDV